MPIGWQTYRHKIDKEESQNKIEETLVTKCLKRIASGIKVVIIGDRGFGRATFFSFLNEKTTDFVIRVSSKVYINHSQFEGLSRDFPLKIGGKVWLEDVLYRQDKAVRINILAIWQKGQEEPWYLATNLSDANLVYQLYHKRMKIEHGFRDWKYHLKLKIPQSRLVRSVERASVLVAAIVLAYWFTCLVGIKAKGRKLEAKVSSWGKISFFRLALELVSSKTLYPPWLSRVLDWVADKLLPLPTLPHLLAISV